jgi:hypothetical protein
MLFIESLLYFFLRKDKSGGGKDVLFEFTVYDVGEDLEFAVGVGTESGARGDTIFVDNTKRTELFMVRVLVPVLLIQC